MIATHDMPVDDKRIGGGDGYLYDIAINPQKNVMLTSSFTGWTNYMMDFEKMVSDPNAMQHFGNTMVLWNHKSMTPQKQSSGQIIAFRNDRLGGRLLMIPASADTRGHGTTGSAKFYKAALADLLKTAPRLSP